MRATVRALADFGAVMGPNARDLFGEVPVTIADIEQWMAEVPGLAPESPRFWQYVDGYRVVEKIREAKLAGTFNRDPSPPRRLRRALAP